ncbi:hypothetical protein ANCDUO_17493 [Ancylostoma duodenale]|uniref:Uncharacterized protein n=1 Tax=Ancylostoma duodenale TaxID=51022 RepID=A0A0C2FV35_9BILA|nr:hypothetical protein ANCDUO_17493 [Ancylostoma duodenale]
MIEMSDILALKKVKALESSFARYGSLRTIESDKCTKRWNHLYGKFEGEDRSRSVSGEGAVNANKCVDSTTGIP